MAIVVARMLQELGRSAEEKLLRIRLNRGVLLSKKPESDFRNVRKGDVYGHKQVPGTEYFVLTHSATEEKAEDLKRICRALGLKAGTFHIETFNPSGTIIA
jgi:hypothetical protein